MKIPASFQQLGATLGREQSAFTITELMVAMGIFSLVTVGMVYSHLIGIKMFNIGATKLSASQGARAALNQIREDIRSAKTVYVGRADASGFTNITADNPRTGNAVEIMESSDTNVFVWYYVDPSDQKLKRRRSQGSDLVEVIASHITNEVAFFAEDYLGNTLTNNQNNRVIRMALDFRQWEFPVATVGAYYSYYHLQTRITRRCIE